MKSGNINIGKITKLDMVKANSAISRNIELENNTGWVSVTKAHKSAKDYNRKPKHKNLEF